MKRILYRLLLPIIIAVGLLIVLVHVEERRKQEQKVEESAKLVEMLRDEYAKHKTKEKVLLEKLENEKTEDGRNEIEKELKILNKNYKTWLIETWREIAEK